MGTNLWQRSHKFKLIRFYSKNDGSQGARLLPKGENLPRNPILVSLSPHKTNNKYKKICVTSFIDELCE